MGKTIFAYKYHQIGLIFISNISKDEIIDFWYFKEGKAIKSSTNLSNLQIVLNDLREIKKAFK